jgi:hypothetical protein
MRRIEKLEKNANNAAPPMAGRTIVLISVRFPSEGESGADGMRPRLITPMRTPRNEKRCRDRQPFLGRL